MVWHSSGENRAARMRSHIPVVIARHPVEPLACRMTGGLFFAGRERRIRRLLRAWVPGISPDQILLW